MDMQKISIDTHLKVDFLPKLAFEGWEKCGLRD